MDLKARVSTPSSAKTSRMSTRSSSPRQANGASLKKARRELSPLAPVGEQPSYPSAALRSYTYRCRVMAGSVHRDSICSCAVSDAIETAAIAPAVRCAGSTFSNGQVNTICEEWVEVSWNNDHASWAYPKGAPVFCNKCTDEQIRLRYIKQDMVNQVLCHVNGELVFPLKPHRYIEGAQVRLVFSTDDEHHYGVKTCIDCGYDSKIRL